jgi:hypothetical protein
LEGGEGGEVSLFACYVYDYDYWVFEGLLIMMVVLQIAPSGEPVKGKVEKSVPGRVFGVDGLLYSNPSCPVLSLSRDHLIGFRELIDQSSSRPALASKLFLFAYACTPSIACG